MFTSPQKTARPVLTKVIEYLVKKGGGAIFFFNFKMFSLILDI